jgi:hypothetical protein
VLHVLRSGREGAYPDLEHVTEQCIAALNPKHKALRKDKAADRLGSLPKDTRKAVEEQLAALERGEAVPASQEPSLGGERPPVRRRAQQQVKFGTKSAQPAPTPAPIGASGKAKEGKKAKSESNQARRIPG